MKTSFDTNLAVYACNDGCPEQEAAVLFLEALALRQDVVVSEFMLVELYLKLRNSKIFAHPMTAPEAAAVCQSFRSNANWELASECRVMDEVWKHAAIKDFAIRRIVDLRLGLSLVRAGVTEFATANLKDFDRIGFTRVWNPLAVSLELKSN
jgi:uncharacterized protein